MLFIDIIHKHDLQNEATSNIEIQQVLSSLFSNDVGIYIGNGPFSSDIGNVNLHPSKGTKWVAYMTKIFFDSYGCVYPKKVGLL